MYSMGITVFNMYSVKLWHIYNKGLYLKSENALKMQKNTIIRIKTYKYQFYNKKYT